MLLLPYTLVLRSHSFISPTVVSADASGSWLYSLVLSILPSGLAQSIFAALLVFFQASAINVISNKNRLARQPALLSGMLYILLVSLIPSYTYLSSSVLANTFLIWALFELFQIYKKAHAAINVFNLGFAIGLAVLLVPPLSVFVLFGVIGIMIIRSFGVVDMLQYLTGIGVSLYLHYSFMYLAGAGPYLLSDYLYSLNFELFSTIPTYLPLFVAVAFIVIVCILTYNGHMLKKNIQIQKKIDLLYWFMGFSFLATLVSQDLTTSLSLPLFISASMLLSQTLIRMKSLLLAELIHIAGLALLFALHFSIL